MASNQLPSLFQCSRCLGELSLDSKTLPSCLHSFCLSCFESQVKVNDKCPECQEHLTLGQFNLSSYLAKSLRQNKLESTDFKCDWCMEDGIDSIANKCCLDCHKLFCDHCCRYHKKSLKEHKIRDLNTMERRDVIKATGTDFCGLHGKVKDCYCKSCNVCLCNECYKSHSVNSPGCSSQPLSVREEALKQKQQGPTLAKEMDDMATSLKKLIEKTKKSTAELSADCDLKCREIWDDFEEMMENAKKRRDKICEDMREMTSEMVEKWRLLIDENENMLKKLEIWRLNLHHLISESVPLQDMGDIVCGLRILESKMSSQFEEEPIDGPEEKCQLKMIYFDWWLQMLERIKTENICSVSLFKDEKKTPNRNATLNIGKVSSLTKKTQQLSVEKTLISINEWKPTGFSTSYTYINSLLVNEIDDHVFIGCYDSIAWRDGSINEFNEGGNSVTKFFLNEGQGRISNPIEMCWVSSDIFVVLGYYPFGGGEIKLFFVKRKRNSPFIEITKIIHTNNMDFNSLCRIDETLYIIDDYSQVSSFTKEGKEINIIKTRESEEKWSLIRSDPSKGILWIAERNESKFICLNKNGEKLKTVEIEESISDFFVDALGDLYFCNREGIYSLQPKKMLHKFRKRSEEDPKIYVSKQKIFVSLKIDRGPLIKIFEISN